MSEGGDPAPAATPSERPAHVRARSGPLGRAGVREGAIVVAAFSVLALVLTWPLAARFATQITSDGVGWDPAGYTWDFWDNAAHGLRLWGSGTREFISAPFGVPLPASANATLLVTLGPGLLVTWLAGPVVAYNVTVLSGLVLSSAAMYLLVRWLGLGIGPAALAGVALMVAPYQLAKAMLHIPFVHLECFPLLLLTGIRWAERPDRGRALWMVGALALGWVTNPYYGIICTVIAAVIVVVAAVRQARSRGPRVAAARTGQLAGLAALLVGVPLAALYLSGRGAISESFDNPRVALAQFGARLSDYVRPDADNVLMRLVVGEDAWLRLAAPGDERTVFVGWVTLALAIVGLVAAARTWPRLGERLRLAVLTCAAATPVLVWFSLASPSRVAGVRLPVPSEAIFSLVPELRAYARFGVAAFVCLLVLAMIGLHLALRGRRAPVGAALGALVGMLLVVNLLPSVPISTAYPVTIAGGDPRDAASWNWLAADDPSRGTVFEYPTGSNAYGAPFEIIERHWQYGQTIHGRPILNGGLTRGALGFDFTRTVLDPTWPGTAGRLAGAGVETVVVNPWAYPSLGQTPPPATPPPPGFAAAATFPDGTFAWHVTAPPDPAAAVFRAGFREPFVNADRLWWPVQPAGGTVTIVPWRDDVTSAEFAVATGEAVPGASVRVMLDGALAARVPVGPAPGRLSVPLPPGDGHRRLRIVPERGAGGAGVVVSQPRFRVGA